MTQNPSRKGLKPALSPKTRFAFRFSESQKHLRQPAPPPFKLNTPRVFPRPGANRSKRIASKIEANPSRPKFTPYFNSTHNLRLSDESTHC